jgi:hypothetical protein
MDGAEDNSFEDQVSFGFAGGVSGVKQGANSVKITRANILEHGRTFLNTL